MRVSLEMQYAHEVERLGKLKEELWEKSQQLYEQRSNLRLLAIDQEFNPSLGNSIETCTALATLEAEIEAIEHEQKRVRALWLDALAHSHKFYLRPERGFPGLLSRPLGAMPQFMPVISPEREKLMAVRDYRRSGFVLFICAIAALVGLVFTVPQLGVSPALFLLHLYSDILPQWLTAPCTVASGYLFVRLLGGDTGISRYCKGRTLDVMAMHEEQWFRAGAESWNIWQRIYSCVAFGTIHIVNFVYPAASLIVVGVVGAAFMATYLREYRRSGSYERAVLASTKLHASYNRFALCYLAVAIVILVISQFVW